MNEQFESVAIDVADLNVGDVYCRIHGDYNSTYAEVMLRYGLVTNILVEGDTRLVVVLERGKEQYSNEMVVESRVFKPGQDVHLFEAENSAFHPLMHQLAESIVAKRKSVEADLNKVIELEFQLEEIHRLHHAMNEPKFEDVLASIFGGTAMMSPMADATPPWDGEDDEPKDPGEDPIADGELGDSPTRP